MAFEDRCSPNSGANSPNSNNNSLSVPNSPESTRTSPYTCLTVSPEKRQGVTNNNNFMRITSFALPSSPKSPEGNMEHSLRSDSPVSSRNTPSPCESIMSSSSMRSRSPDEEPRIQTLKYSIVNILQPDFGKTALKTRISSSSTNKISFKPYARLTSENNKYHNISNEDVKPSLLTPPLGSLCQTVSQIGANLSLGISAKKTLDSPLLGLRKNSSVTTETCLIGGSKTVEEKKDATLPVAANNFPAWVYCTRYSDRPSSGPRSRRMKKQEKANEEKRPRTAFSSAQLQRLKQEFNENRYLTEHRRQKLSSELGLNEAQIKIWFQNKRAKQKKSSGEKNPLALQLMAQGLYNHSTVACDEDEMMSLQN